MAKEFTAAVDEWVKKSKINMRLLVMKSANDVIDQAQKTDEEGGLMRVDTGFLRASGQASLSGVPAGPTRGEFKEPDSYDFDADSVIATIGEFQLGNTIYFGWTADYAKYREAYDGFLESSLQNWPDIVKRNTAELKRRFAR